MGGCWPAIMGASLGATGTARAQYHLRQIFVTLNLFTLNQPEVIIADAAHRFDENGNLIHEPTKQLIQKLLKNLVDWTRRISSDSQSALVEMGAEAVTGDALDAASVKAVIQRIRPDAIINELTSLPRHYT